MCEELVCNAHEYVELVAPDETVDDDEAMAEVHGEVLSGYLATYRRFVAAMTVCGVWGDGVTLTTLSQALCRLIIVLRRGDDTTLGCNVIRGGWSHEEMPESQQARLREAKEAPLALWYTGSHYQAVVGKREAVENAVSKALFETQRPPVAILPAAAPTGERLNRQLQALTTVTARRETEVVTTLVPEQWQVEIVSHVGACAAQTAAVVLCHDEQAASLWSANAHATAALETKPRTLPAIRTEGTLFFRARGTAQATSQGVAWQVGPDVFKRAETKAETLAATCVVLYASIKREGKEVESAAQLLHQGVWSAGGTALGRGTMRGPILEMRWGVPPSSVRSILNRSGTLEGKACFPTVRPTFEEAHKWRVATTWLEEGTMWAEADELDRTDDFAGFAMHGKVIGVRRWVDVNNPGP